MDVLLDTGFWAVVGGSAFILLLIIGIAGSFLESRMKGKAPPKSAGMAVMLLCLALCIILALSFIPLMVITVLGFQEVIGNRGVAPIGFLLDHQAEIIIALWAIIIGGSLLAVPAMLHDLKKEL